jgi:hypothetical protein
MLKWLKELGILEEEKLELDKLITLRNRYRDIENTVEKLKKEKDKIMKEIKIEEKKLKKR